MSHTVEPLCNDRLALETEEMAIVERLKQKSIYGLSVRWPLVEVQLYILQIAVVTCRIVIAMSFSYRRHVGVPPRDTMVAVANNGKQCRWLILLWGSKSSLGRPWTLKLVLFIIQGCSYGKNPKGKSYFIYTKSFSTARDLNVVWHVSEKKFKLALLQNREPYWTKNLQKVKR